MKVVAFLQNAYFKDPNCESAKLYVSDPEFRRKALAQSMTGSRLLSALGKDLFNLIHWDNATDEVGDERRSSLPAKPSHILNVVNRLRPYVILTFGRTAKDGVVFASQYFNLNQSLAIFCMSHPSAMGLTKREMGTWRPMIEAHLRLVNSRHYPQ